MGSIQETTLIRQASVAKDGSTVTIEFPDGVFTFHAQWLHDARCDKTQSRTALTAFCQVPATAGIRSTSVQGTDKQEALDIEWQDGNLSSFPTVWLRVIAPTVARLESPVQRPVDGSVGIDYRNGWTVDTLRIPELDYQDLIDPAVSEKTVLKILDLLLLEPSAGIIKVVNLPAANVEEERGKANTIVTRVLKMIFGSVFVHPRRGTDKTFNVASHQADEIKRAENLPNYDTAQILLPHCDHAHYTYPIQVQGWYGLEGVSENTFVSSIAVLETLKAEHPELVRSMFTAPMAMGRLAPYYDPPLFQGTVDPAVTADPANHQKVKRVRWHPHLTGSLLTPFEDFELAREAHCKFQEIMRRDTHQLKVALKPGDLYIWNNHRIVHGRERVLEVPRTGVGQTVPEQTVQELWRSVLLGRLAGHIEDKWLVHTPPAQLRHMAELLHVM